jgi:hypothetical protein
MINDNMTEPHCLIGPLIANPGFRMSSPRHENGFAGLLNHFVAIERMKQVHAIAIGRRPRLAKYDNEQART